MGFALTKRFMKRLNSCGLSIHSICISLIEQILFVYKDLIIT